MSLPSILCSFHTQNIQCLTFTPFCSPWLHSPFLHFEPFLLSLMSVFVGLGAEQLTKEATVLRGLSLSLSRRVYGKLAPMEEGDPCPRRVWCLPSRSSSPGICPRQAGVSRPPPPSRHFIPGISGWFVGLTLLCLRPHSHSEFSFVLLRELGVLMPLPLGLAVGAPAEEHKSELP